jgi:hypothetical protein
VTAKRRLVAVSLRARVADVDRVESGLQDHDADADARLADVAFALAAPFERGAVPRLAVGDLLVRCAFFDPATVPHGYRDEGGEPQDGV